MLVSQVTQEIFTDDFTIHIFCHASGQAYAARIYMKSITDGKIRVKLLVAKTAVSPLNCQSNSRLERSAALLGATLVEAVKEVLSVPSFPELNFYGWSFFTVFLSWIAQSPEK